MSLLEALTLQMILICSSGSVGSSARSWIHMKMSDSIPSITNLVRGMRFSVYLNLMMTLKTSSDLSPVSISLDLMLRSSAMNKSLGTLASC